MPQFDFLFENNNLLVDKILFLENLEKDFEPIRKEYDLNKLPKVNVSKNKKDWRDHYTLETAELIYKKYKKDFDIWYS